MKSLAIVALFALCAICYAEDAPSLLFPCSFHTNFKITIRTLDGEVLATSLNEMLRDNGEFWVWKSEFSGSDFMKSIVPDHSWAITWRPDVSRVFRHDILDNRCYNMSIKEQPLPYDWIQSKTYGIVWYDELINFKGQDCYLFTAVVVGKYYNYDYEIEGNFYVTAADKKLVYINGTASAKKGEVQVLFEADNVFFEHNIMIPTKSFVVNAPCPAVAAPADPSDSFAATCYQGNGYVLTVSWVVLLVAMLVALLNF